MRVLSFVAVLAGCGGNIYGYSRTYEPLSDEEDFYESASAPTYEEVKRDPAEFRAQRIGWFGIVKELRREGRKTVVSMSHRAHVDRHLCSDMEADTCRVTVQERSEGDFSAIVRLQPDDAGGQNRVQINSLLRIYGKPNGDYDASGGPVLVAEYYRHWPRGQYVTTAARGSMRR
jgi:hypothetical protein